MVVHRGMPLYEYHCNACNRDYEFLFKSYPTKQQLSRLKCETESGSGPLEKKISAFNIGKEHSTQSPMTGCSVPIDCYILLVPRRKRAQPGPSPVRPLGAHELN